jgi:PAS domain S-box-containing protein
VERDRFFTLSPDLLATVRADGHFVELNSAWTRDLGWTLDELRARRWIEFVHPDDVARTLEVPQTAAADAVIHFENRYQHRDGSYRWLAWSASRRIDGTAYVIARDVTEAKNTESALREHSEQLREEAEISAALARVGGELLSSVATTGLLDRVTLLTAEAVRCDASYILFWDPEANAYAVLGSHGATPEQRELLRAIRFPVSVVEPFHAALERGEIAHMLRSQAPERLQEAVFKPFDVQVLMVVALRRGDAIIGVIDAVNRTCEVPFTAQQQRILQGIAQLASFALENARLFEELERANRFRSDFVATMSHELRTPMNVILGYHELLLDGTFGPLAPAQAAPLRRANRSACELLDLVTATLDLSRLETDRIPLAIEEMTAAGLLDDVAAEIAVPPERAALELSWDAPPKDVTLRTDRVKARMVLKNLVGNAIKFTENGRVTVGAQALDGGVEFVVSDTGIGIAPEAQEYIFEPFRQIDAGSTRRYGGAGLGLYIVRRLLDALGGTIALVSDLGHGATFRVWLPDRAGRDQPGA